MQKRKLLAQKEERQCISKNMQMGVDYVRLALIELGGQSEVHAVIESRPFSQVSNFHPGLVQQSVEIAVHAIREGNDNWFKSPAIQASCDVNGDALGPTRAEHRNNMYHSNFIHDF